MSAEALNSRFGIINVEDVQFKINQERSEEAQTLLQSEGKPEGLRNRVVKKEKVVEQQPIKERWVGEFKQKNFKWTDEGLDPYMRDDETTDQFIKRHYTHWFARSAFEEFGYCVSYHFIGVPRTLIFLYTCYQAYFIGLPAWKELGLIIAVALFMEPFPLAAAHMHVHMSLLECFQRRKIVKEIAFHHHFIDCSQYMKVPYGHAMSYTSANCLFAMLAYYYNFNSTAFLIINQSLYFDQWIHTWYHTPRYMYDSWNYFSAHFKPFLYVLLFCEKLGLSEKPKHAIHHKCEAENQEEIESFVDFYIPVSSQISYYFCEAIYYAWKKYLIFMRGTDVAMPFAAGSEELRKANSLWDVVPTWFLSRMMVPAILIGMLECERYVLPSEEESVFGTPEWYLDWRLVGAFTAAMKYVICFFLHGRISMSL